MPTLPDADAVGMSHRRLQAARASEAGDWQRAEALWRSLAHHPRGRREDCLAYLTALRVTRNAAAAQRFLETVAPRFPADPALETQIAYVLEALGDHQGAAERWLALLESGKSDPSHLFQLGVHLKDAGRVTLAEKILSDCAHAAARAGLPELALDAWRQHAALAEMAGDWPAALDRWNHVRTLGGGTPDDIRHLCHLLLRTKQFDAARKLLSASGDAGPQKLRLEALIAEAENRWDDAEAALLRLLDQSPAAGEDAALTAQLARIHLNQGHYPAVVRRFLDAVKNAPDAPQPAALIAATAQALRKLGQREQALRLLEKYGPQAEEGRAAFVVLQGELLLELKRCDALKGLLASLDALSVLLDPHLARLKGHLALAERDWETAATAFSQVNRTELANAVTWFQEANAYFQLADSRNLSICLRKALAEFPEASPLLELAGRFAEQEGDWEGACAAWGKALSLQTSSRSLAIRYALACFEAGKPHHALELLRREDLRVIDDAETACLHSYAALVQGDNEKLKHALSRCDIYCDRIKHRGMVGSLVRRIRAAGRYAPD